MQPTAHHLVAPNARVILSFRAYNVSSNQSPIVMYDDWQARVSFSNLLFATHYLNLKREITNTASKYFDRGRALCCFMVNVNDQSSPESGSTRLTTQQSVNISHSIHATASNQTNQSTSPATMADNNDDIPPAAAQGNNNGNGNGDLIQPPNDVYQAPAANVVFTDNRLPFTFKETGMGIRFAPAPEPIVPVMTNTRGDIMRFNEPQVTYGLRIAARIAELQPRPSQPRSTDGP